MDQQALRRENLAFRGTMGVSQNNTYAGFVPAFREDSTGRVELARFRNGNPAPFHLIEGLPREWAVSRAMDGSITAIKPGVTAGFVRNARFYTRDEVDRVA